MATAGKLLKKNIVLLIISCFGVVSCSESNESKAIASAKRLVAVTPFENAEFRNVIFIKDITSPDNNEKGSLRGYVCGELKSEKYPNYTRFSLNILLYENYTRTIAARFKIYSMDNSCCDVHFEKEWQSTCVQ